MCPFSRSWNCFWHCVLMIWLSGVQSWPQPVRLHHYGLFTLEETDSETSSVNTPLNGTGTGTRTGTGNISLLRVISLQIMWELKRDWEVSELILTQRARVGSTLSFSLEVINSPGKRLLRRRWLAAERCDPRDAVLCRVATRGHVSPGSPQCCQGLCLPWESSPGPECNKVTVNLYLYRAKKKGCESEIFLWFSFVLFFEEKSFYYKLTRPIVWTRRVLSS